MCIIELYASSILCDDIYCTSFFHSHSGAIDSLVCECNGLNKVLPLSIDSKINSDIFYGQLHVVEKFTDHLRNVMLGFRVHKFFQTPSRFE
jgi:hypothetical protein